jgi:DNA repair protein REV1
MSLSELVRSIGENIRGDIIAETQCTVTIGIGENKLLAKLGADKVKQNGGNNLLHVKDSESFMQNVKLRELPGIGYKLGKKLHSKNLLNVQDILDYGDEGKIQLTTILGPGNGTKLFNYCRGKDDRRVEASPRKTIGAECNYGVRFDGPYGVDHMVMGLSTEVEKRMESVGVLGKNITVKIKQRKPNAPPPGKFNGHGPCFDHSKSANLPTNTATRDASLISVQAMELFDALCIEKDDIRGMGIVISKLESANSSSVLHGGMEKWLDDKSFKRDRNENCTSASSNIQSNQKSETPGCIDKEPLGNNTAKEVHEPSNHQKVRIQSTHTREETSTSNNGKATRIRTKKKPTSRPPRQNDVKRMFKLASVKAGLDQISINGDPVSLTQLDSLPLDVQLQVANHDNIRARMNGMKTQNASTTVIELSDSDDSVIAYESSIAEGPLQCDEGSNFYQSNILPFRKYLDASMEPSEEDVRKVRTFLHICFDEKRLDDLVMYLRIIKQRKNDWGTIHYPTILREVVEIAKKKEGRNLDLVSLGLT